MGTKPTPQTTDLPPHLRGGFCFSFWWGEKREGFGVLWIFQVYQFLRRCGHPSLVVLTTYHLLWICLVYWDRNTTYRVKNPVEGYSTSAISSCSWEKLNEWTPDGWIYLVPVTPHLPCLLCSSETLSAGTSVLILFLFLFSFIQQDPKPGALDSSRGVRSRSRLKFLSLGPFSRNETDVICMYRLV